MAPPLARVAAVLGTLVEGAKVECLGGLWEVEVGALPVTLRCVSELI